jgi:hypothetical protein
MDKHKNWVFFPLFIAPTVSTLYLFIGRLGFDPHHQGLMLAAANAQANGLLPFENYLAMYGPFVSLGHSIGVALFGPNVISIIIISVLALSLGFTLLWCVTASLYGRLAANITLALTIAATPFFRTSYTFLPWNSDFILLFQALLIHQIFRLIQIGRCKKAQVHEMAVAVLLAMILWSRLTVGVLTVLAILTSFLILGMKKEFKNVFIYFIACNLLGIIYLVGTGSVNEFVFQYISFPRSLFVNTLGLNGLVQIIKSLVLYLPVALVAFTFLTDSRRKNSKFPSNIQRVLTMVLALIEIALLAALGKLNLLIGWQLLHWVIAIWLFIGPVLGFLKRVIVREYVGFSLIEKKEFVFICVALASLAQIFPVSDPYHLWWSLVPATGIAIGWVIRGNSFSEMKIACSLGALIVLIGFSLFEIKSKVSSDWVLAPSIRPVSGLYVSSNQADTLIPLFELASKFQDEVGDKAALNICRDGVFASIGRDQSFQSPFFVSWPGAEIELNNPGIQEFIQLKQPMIFACNFESEKEFVQFELDISKIDYTMLKIETCRSNGPGLPEVTMSYPETWLFSDTDLKTLRHQICLKVLGRD